MTMSGRMPPACARRASSGTISAARCDDAFMRLRRAKERFLMGDRPAAGQRIRNLRQVLGRAEHQQVAAEMAAFL